MKRFSSFIYGIRRSLLSVCVCVWRNLLLVILTAAFLLSIPSPVSAYYTNMPASVVVGQPDFTSNGTGTTASTFSSPTEVFIDNTGRMIIGDLNNNRVLIWNKVPTTNGVPADLVLGQADFISGSANRGGSADSNTFSNPSSIFSDGTKLFVADNNNARVLIWNSFPISNGQSADVVVGQTSMIGTSQLCAQSGLNLPYGVRVFNGKMVISDRNQRRVLIWNSIPTTNGAAADIVIGQQNFSSCAATTASQNNITRPRGLEIDSIGRLFVSDETNNRIMVWNSLPSINYAPADIVIGQTNFTSTSAGISASQVTATRNVFSSGKRFFYPDGSRVLIWNTVPTVNGASADIVLGQTSFTTNSANCGGAVSASCFSGAARVFEYKNKLFVSEATNNRILIFNDITNVPRLGISTIGGVPLNTTNSPEAGRLRISGNLSVDGGLYNLWKLEASVNGGDYAPVTSLSNSVATNSTHDPSKQDTVSSTFYHDFEPWNLNGQPLGNGNKQEWIDNQQDMLSSYGYTLKLKGYTNNTDTNPIFFLSKPLTITSPTNVSCHSRAGGNPETTGSPIESGMTNRETGMTEEGCMTNAQLPTLSRTPTITFSVNSKQRTELKENLVHYEVWVKRIMNLESGIMNTELGIMNEEGEWTKYIDTIPIDYDIVRDYEDNLRKGIFDGNKDEGNGTYENNNLIVTFTKNSSQLSVRKKGNQEGTLNNLPSGIYHLKVVAVDKANHPQDSDNEITVKITGSPQINNPKNLSITTDWFPLQINSIQGSSTGIINPSTSSGQVIISQQTTQTTIQTSTQNPTIQGIAFSGSTITLTITDQQTGEYRTYTTQTKDSTWSITPHLYTNSFLDLSVESVEGKYNEVPTVTITVFES